MKCFSVKSSVQSQVVCVRSSVSAGGRSKNLGAHAGLIKGEQSCLSLHQGFQRDGTVQLFGTKGQARNLTKGRDRPGQPKFGMGRAGIAKIRDGGQDRPEMLKFGMDGPGQSKSGTGCRTKRDRAEKDILKQKNDDLKQKMLF